MPVNGLVTMTPSSVAKTGTGSTATINTNGSVTFSSCATVSLNGVFTSSYDNYMIAMRFACSSPGGALEFRFRASGTDNSASNAYVSQLLAASSTSGTGNRLTQTTARIATLPADTPNRDGCSIYLFGPYLSQATAWRSNAATNRNDATAITHVAGTHNQATSYDGLTLIIDTVTIEGLITVYGFNQ